MFQVMSLVQTVEIVKPGLFSSEIRQNWAIWAEFSSLGSLDYK